MKFSEKAKHVTCGVVMGAMLATAVPATASQITKSIQATYNNIKIIVDGQQVSTNKNNEPFIYNGTTYLPIRAVGEAVGKQVSWDGRTNTVYLGDSPVSSGEQYLVDVCPPYEGGGWTYESVKMAGRTYVKALSVFANYSGSADSTLINLDGKYNMLEFDFGHADGRNNEVTYSFYIDGTLVDTITLEKDQMPTHYSVPLYYGLQLKIESTGSGAFMANCIVK